MKRSSSPEMVILVVVALAVSAGVGWMVTSSTNLFLGLGAGVVAYPLARLPIWTRQIREAKRLARLPSIPQEDFADLGSIGRAVYISNHAEPAMDSATNKWQSAWRTEVLTKANELGDDTVIHGLLEAGELEPFWHSLYTEYHLRNGDVTETLDASVAIYAELGQSLSVEERGLVELAIRSAFSRFEGITPLSTVQYESPYIH
ncbi:MAG: hypothetical protein HKN91_08085 [Acidimicrobiia bacterium]|nr:hypothetical protein [Acidimicrobiia bacterium]